MNFQFAEKINPDLAKLDTQKAIATVEAALTSIPTTPFHLAIGKSLNHLADELAIWIEDFFNAASDQLEVQALYFEMNEFDINTDFWYIDGFAYAEDQGQNPEDMDWLSAWDADSQSLTGGVFTLEGYEKLQTAFETIDPENQDVQDAKDWAEQLIIARFMDLMKTAQLAAGEQGLNWANLPIYFTEHGYDFIVRSEI